MKTELALAATSEWEPSSVRRLTATQSDLLLRTTLYEKLPFDFIRDSAPIGGTMLLTNVLVVHPSVPAKTVAEFIEYVKAKEPLINAVARL